MRKLTPPPRAFWRAWLLLTARIFMRILLCLCVGWSLFAWLLPPFALPPPPAAFSSDTGLDPAPARQDE
ncbi:hypothetical protein ASD35_03730 [Pelomonas sp. Root1444]|nr:hypothetical protein ASD35_03730 [Pelomonas sp. Root1444]